MGDKFKHIGDSFKEDAKPVIRKTKPFADMTPDDQMNYLIDYCARNDIWSRSTHKLDREWFIRVHEKYDASWTDVKEVIEFKERYLIELDKIGKMNYKDLRRVITDQLPKWIASKRAKQGKNNAVKQGQILTAPAVKNLPAVTPYTVVKCSHCKSEVQFRDTVTGVSVNDRICNNCVPASCSMCNKIKTIGEMTLGNKIGEMFCRECAVNADVTCVRCKEKVKAAGTIPGRKFGEIICRACAKIQTNQN